MAFPKSVPPEAFPLPLGEAFPLPPQKCWFGCWVQNKYWVYVLHPGGLPCFALLDSLVNLRMGAVEQVLN